MPSPVCIVAEVASRNCQSNGISLVQVRGEYGRSQGAVVVELACNKPMAATHGADVVSLCIMLADLEGLQAFTPPKFDWTQPLGEHRLPALMFTVHHHLTQTNALQTQSLKIVDWLLKVGANPAQRLDHDFTYKFVKMIRKEATGFFVAYRGHSAVSLALQYRTQMKMLGGDWSQEDAHLKSVLARFAAASTSCAANVTVPQGTLDLWESMRDLTTSHNVIFQSSDGDVSAHDQILMLASPVLNAMLTSEMKEGSSWRIQVEDSSSSGVSLFLDLLYTSSTREDPDHETMLVALDLAHRWQVHGVVQTLCNGLRDMIDASSFVDIAEAASLKGLESLGRACAYFGSKDEQIQAMLRKGSLPVAVRRLLGEPVDAFGGQQDTKKRRVFFCS